MLDFKARKQSRIQDEKDGVKFCFKVIVNSITFNGYVVETFDSKQEASNFTKQLGPMVGNCRAMHVLFSRHPNSFISDGIRFEIVREKI